jgi:hypothetical protein
MNLLHHLADHLAAPQLSGKARVSWTLAKFSFVVGLLTGIPAIVLGILGLRDIRRSAGRVGGHVYALGGITAGTATSVAWSLLLFVAGPVVLERPARTQAEHRLKHIGLALYDYHDTHQVFPAPVGTYRFRPGQHSGGETVCEVCRLATETDRPEPAPSPSVSDQVAERELPFSWRVAIGPYLEQS